MKTPENTYGLIKLKDAARMLGISYFTVARWVRDGKLPAYKMGAVYITQTDIEEMLRRNRTVNDIYN